MRKFFKRAERDPFRNASPAQRRIRAKQMENRARLEALRAEFLREEG